MKSKFIDSLSHLFFRWVHQNNLIYNTCWEDPRIDRSALKIKPTDRLLMITSAGCNALDYALDRPKHIHAVDMNPRQNALLDLKISAIRNLDFGDFFQIFGRGSHPHFKSIYREKLRADLPPRAQKIWDADMSFFQRDSFYFQGTSGLFARGIYEYINLRKVRDIVGEIFEAQSLSEQSEIYHRVLKPRFWSSALKYFLGTDLCLALLGVPRAQRRHLEQTYPGGIIKFMEDSLEAVLTKLPLFDNYFWWLYFNGRYSENRSPLYLQEPYFNQLKAGDVDRISTHTSTITSFLKDHDAPISKFILLDHMDWLAAHDEAALAEEWRFILMRSSQDARYLWRSGSTDPEFVSRIVIDRGASRERVGERLKYHREWASDLHKRDRVHTYGSFAIADLAA